jgi:hypothetical protein
MSSSENHDAAQPQDETAPAPDAKPQAKVAPSAETASAPKVKAEPEAPAASTAELGILVKTMVGDLEQAGLLKDPERAGHIVADAIIAVEAPVPAAKAKAVP